MRESDEIASQFIHCKVWPGLGRFAAAYRVLEEAIAARAFPGCAFGVLAGGHVALAGCVGPVYV